MSPGQEIYVCTEWKKTCTHFNWLSLCVFISFILMCLLLFKYYFDVVAVGFFNSCVCTSSKWFSAFHNSFPKSSVCMAKSYACAWVNLFCVFSIRCYLQFITSYCYCYTIFWAKQWFNLHVKLILKWTKYLFEWLGLYTDEIDLVLFSQLISILQKLKEIHAIKMMICDIVLFISSNSSSSTLSQINTCWFDWSANW